MTEVVFYCIPFSSESLTNTADVNITDGCKKETYWNVTQCNAKERQMVLTNTYDPLYESHHNLTLYVVFMSEMHLLTSHGCTAYDALSKSHTQSTEELSNYNFAEKWCPYQKVVDPMIERDAVYPMIE